MKPEEIDALIRALPSPTLVIGVSQTIIAANAPARSLLGDPSIGRHYITALRQPGLLDAIETAALTEQVTRGRFLSREAGKDTIFAVHIGPVGGLLVLTFTDTTAAEEAGQMRRDFVANVSHELRTPLTALMGFIETLRGAAREDPDAQARFLAIMDAEAGRMTQIVDDLLSLSRVEAEERIRPHQEVRLGAVVSACLTELEQQIESAGCAVTFDDQSADQTVPGDAAQLHQVVSNLLVNALRYGAAGKRVDVALSSPQDEPSLRAKGLRLTVRDYGEGMEEHHLVRLTERFYRVDSHRSRAVGGTGLGLAIVKHIINRHRGRLQIASTLGEGSSFTVILPIAAD